VPSHIGRPCSIPCWWWHSSCRRRLDAAFVTTTPNAEVAVHSPSGGPRVCCKPIVHSLVVDTPTENANCMRTQGGFVRLCVHIRPVLVVHKVRPDIESDLDGAVAHDLALHGRSVGRASNCVHCPSPVHGHLAAICACGRATCWWTFWGVDTGGRQLAIWCFRVGTVLVGHAPLCRSASRLQKLPRIVKEPAGAPVVGLVTVEQILGRKRQVAGHVQCRDAGPVCQHLDG